MHFRNKGFDCILFWHPLLLCCCLSRIMGLYVSVVLVIGKFVRGFFSEISHSIMFEELPCVDRILKLCTDIFLVRISSDDCVIFQVWSVHYSVFVFQVRETGELELEEELYSKLIFLYRSPETMIKWTRDNHTEQERRWLWMFDRQTQWTLRHYGDVYMLDMSCVHLCSLSSH